jgi:hypothetical protein
MKNWKTTAAGISAIMLAIGSALSAISAGTPIDYTAVIAAVLAGVGLVMAKDASVKE